MHRLRIGALASPALLIVSMVSSGNLLADWTGGIEGGQVLQGREKGTRLRFKLSNSDRPFSQAIYADWIRGEDEGNSYEVGYIPRYWFTETTYAFGEGSLETSESLNIDRETRLLAGVGIQLFNTDTQSLYAEAGAGVVDTKFRINGVSSEETTGIATARMGAAQVLSDLIKLELNADYSTADELVSAAAEAAISLRIPGGAIKYSYRIRSFDTEGQEQFNETDSSISFNYGF